jgi:hypothetical protein
MAESQLEVLVGQQLGSVVFVMDYVQLDFSTARFTACVWPTVEMGDVLHFGDMGYRDALCGFIAHDVVAADESPETGLVIRFDLGQIVTNPEPADLIGAGIAQLQVHEKPFQAASFTVWRPGEDVFAGRDWS